MSLRVRDITARAALIAAIASAMPLLAIEAQGGGRQLRRQEIAIDSAAPFERGLARVVQRQLGLSDQQLLRLQAVDKRFRQRRVANQLDEVQARRAIRRALAGGAAPSATAPLDTLLDRIVQVQADRVAILRSEQSELQQFLTPVQRARYLGIQEFLRRRAKELRAEDATAGRGGQQADTTRPKRAFRRLRP